MGLLNDKWWIQRQRVFLILAVSISTSPSTNGGDLRNLVFHCNPRGLGAFYYLFFSSPASSLPSHFLTLIILQSVSCFFLISSHTMISYLGLHGFICVSRKNRQRVDNYVTWCTCVFGHVSYLVNSPKGPWAKDLNSFEFGLFQDAKLGLVGCCSTGC